MSIAMACSTAFAQEAFKHLGISLEAGTTGLGVNLSYPLVTDHLTLSLGCNFPSYNINKTVDLDPSYVNNRVAGVNQMVDRYNDGASRYNTHIDPMAEIGISLSPMSQIEKVSSVEKMEGDIKAKLNFANYKAMLEYYPTTKSYFHFTVGVFVGNGEWMNISAVVDPVTWGTYKSALSAADQAISAVEKYNTEVPQHNLKIQDINAQIDEYNKTPGAAQKKHLPLFQTIDESAPVDDAAAVTVNGQTFVLDKNSDGRVDVTLAIKKVKPYLGVGFGSSVPTKRRCGFQMEIGAYYQGKPTLESTQEKPSFAGSSYNDHTIDKLVETICYLQWYPQLTFRWTGRLF